MHMSSFKKTVAKELRQNPEFRKRKVDGRSPSGDSKAKEAGGGGGRSRGGEYLVVKIRAS